MDQESAQIRNTMATKVPIEEDILEIEGEEEKDLGQEECRLLQLWKEGTLCC